MAVTVGGTLDDLLEFVKTTRGFDFTGYKRSSVERRVAKRMAAVGVERYDEYREYLELHGDEFAQLFNALLISVTGFFRDPQTWEHLATEVLPPLIDSRDPDAPLRIWCPGCASGEEAYTVAMVLARILGDAAFRDRVKIYATDIDAEGLAQARQGTYQPRQIEDVPRGALERFFVRSHQCYAFRPDLRRSVIFGSHDLIHDAPISRLDLLVCRNTLVYFRTETQTEVLRRFHFALADDGILLLGKSEMLVGHAGLFTPLDLRWRAFRKVVPHSVRDERRVPAADPGNRVAQGAAEDLREAALDAAEGAQIVLDAERSLVMANDAARALLGIRVTDLGRAVYDLELSCRPVELRDHLNRLGRERRRIDIPAVRWSAPGREVVLDVRVVPLLRDGEIIGTSVVYEDVTDRAALQAELTASKRTLERAYEELRAAVEELETTNEELQSANEELERANEELQAVNRDLERTNGELQAVNQELHLINDELRRREASGE